MIQEILLVFYSKLKLIKFETQKYHLQTSVFLIKLQQFRLKLNSYKILRKTFQINYNTFYHDLDERCCVHN